MSTYHLLGRTGLLVSPLALGAMTFGRSSWGTQDWGCDEETSRSIFRRYLDTGGNFVDTANLYTNGMSEELLGKFIRETGSRDRVVLATKFSGPTDPANPNAAGNGRKNIMASLEASLRRLDTDYVDLYWLHMWDTMTPAETVMSTFDSLVRSGKVRAIGLSDVPAWYVARAQTLAEARGWEPVAALQLEYSLVERNIEREHIPAAGELGIGIIPWSPLASGFLTGKYTRTEGGPAGEGRLRAFGEVSGFFRYGDREWGVLDTLIAVADEVGRTPAQVALNWVTRRPGVTSTLIGARSLAQLDDNLAALDFDLTEDQVRRLTEAGEPELHHPYSLFDPELRAARFRSRGAEPPTILREPRRYR